MKRLVVTSPGQGTSVRDVTVEVETVPTPKPLSGQVLIKVSAAPVNPSDYGAWYRGVNHKKDGKSVSAYPMAMGIEGCGVVVSYSGMAAGLRCPVGTPVGFVIMDKRQGSYSEYVTVSAFGGAFPMPADCPIEDCASFFVNPYTVVGILDTARKEANSKVIVITAAASQVGQMLNKLVADPAEGITLINVVRREEQAELLRGLGAEHVVVTNASGTDEAAWTSELKSKIKELGATCAFDCVGGDMTGTLLEVLPSKGTVYNYGTLAGRISNVNGLDLIYRKKSLKGWLLNHWIFDGGSLFVLPRLYAAAGKVNAGLNGGWSSSQFVDTAPVNTFRDLVALMDSSTGSTGKKLRIRFDDTSSSTDGTN